MEKMLKLPFHASYERDIKGSYLVLKLEMNDHIHEYQVEMMMNNEIPSLLSFNLRQKDAHKYLYYDVTSKLQLGQLLARRKLKKEELIEVLIEILQGISNGGNYLLHSEGFIIDENFVFIHPETLQVSLLYIPSSMKDRNTIFELRQLINRLIWSMDSQQETNDKLLLKVLYELNKETFNLKDFLMFLRELKVAEPKVSEPKGAELNVESPIINREKSTPKEIQVNENRKTSKNTNLEKSREEVAVTIEEEVRVGYSQKTKLMILLTEVLILIVVALLFLETSLLIDSTGRIDGVSVMGVFLLVGVVNVLLMKKLLVKENLVTVKAEKKPSSKMSPLKMNKKEINNAPKELNYPIRPIIEESFDTEIIEIKKSSPQLIPQHGGQQDKININKEIFVIGKLKEQVDFAILNKTISRVHGEISYIEGQYYLKDLNSRNGTYLNGNRINSNLDYILKHEDKVSFADLDYIFSIPLDHGAD